MIKADRYQHIRELLDRHAKETAMSADQIPTAKWGPSHEDPPPEGVTDEERCGGWYATHDEETGGFKRVWHCGFLTLEEARACPLHEQTEHGKRAVLFAERIGSDRLRLRGNYALVCCNCVDDVKGFPNGWPTFGGLRYEFAEADTFSEVKGSLSAKGERSLFSIGHETLTNIIDAADYARYGYWDEHVRVHADHAEMACSALAEFHETDLPTAVALAAIQHSLLQLWRPKKAAE